MSQSGSTCTAQTPFTAIDDYIAASLGVHFDAASAFKAEIEVTLARCSCRTTLAGDTAETA